MTFVLLLATTVVVLDQITKTAALAHLIPGHPLVLVDGWLSLTLVMNPGLAFGLLGTVLPAGGFTGVIAIGLIFGGAVGNLIDRARFGAVVDFVDVHWRTWHWPAFNVADSAITVGVVLLALRLLTERSATSGRGAS